MKCECCGQTIKAKRFKKPTLDEVLEYCEERANSIDPEAFIDFYDSKDWMIGKNKMKNWQAAVRTWERREKKNETGKRSRAKSVSDKLDEIAKKDINQNGFAPTLD